MSASRAVAKAAVLALAALLFATGLGGCGFGMTSEEQARQQMQRHLEGKYGQIDYTEVVVRLASLLEPHDTLEAYLAGGDKEADAFTVRRYYDEEKGEYRFTDNYYGLLVREDYEQMVHEVADKYFEECKVYCRLSSPFPNDLTKDVTLEEAIARGEVVGANIHLLATDTFGGDEAAFKERSEQFFIELGSNKLPSYIWVDCLTNSTFETITRPNLGMVTGEGARVFEQTSAAFRAGGERLL